MAKARRTSQIFAGRQERATSQESALAARLLIVRIGLRFRMTWRRIAAAAGIGVAGAVRDVGPQAYFSFLDLFQSVRHQQRERQANCYDDPRNHRRSGVLPCNEQLDSGHTSTSANSTRNARAFTDLPIAAGG